MQNKPGLTRNGAQEAGPTFIEVDAIRSDLESGKLTSVELVQQALEKVQQHTDFNIFITVDRSGSLAAAKKMDELRAKGTVLGPLHGIPFVVKDNIFVGGLPNTAGTPGFRNFIPDQDAPVVERMKAAGAIMLGKTNMHELAYGITSDNYAFGPVRNAQNPDCISGGSSGGTAVAVALGIASIGLGTDTGGSSRIPAALNGIVGFRPTVGRYPHQGLTRISHTRDTVGPMATSVADVGLLDALLSDDSPPLETASLRGLRLGVPRAYFYQNLDVGIEEKTEGLLNALRDQGVDLVEVDIPGMGELNEKVGFPVCLFETGQLLTEFLLEHRLNTKLDKLVKDVASPDVKAILESVVHSDVSAEVYRQALNVDRPRLQQVYRDYFSINAVDAMIFPTTPLSATLIKDSLGNVELGGTEMPVFAAFIRNTDPASNAGIPGLTIPVCVCQGDMPIGIEIDGPEGSDRKLLAIGAAIEALIACSSGYW